MLDWEIIRALATVAAAIIAGFALNAALRTYRASFRPVLRPALLYLANGTISSKQFILKNIGRGPAVSVFLVEPEPPPGQPWPSPNPGPVMLTLDVVEPLGAHIGGSPVDRIGRVVLSLPATRLLRLNTTYRLLYQDLSARWHETTFRIETDTNNKQRVLTRYLGALHPLRVELLPDEVTKQAQVVHDEQ